MIQLPARTGEETLPGTGAVEALDPGLRRRIVSPVELRRWLTAEIRKHERCGEVRVIGVTRLQKAGEDGCNWSYHLVLEPGGAPALAYTLACIDAVTRGRALFNLSL